jgi:undecaprenyl-diphosphatase
MTILQIVILAAIQGAAELLPVSSSAHVIVAERLMGLDPSSPELTFLLVMLHTGTMFAVLVYFWKRWAALLRAKSGFLKAVVVATAVTGVVGLTLKVIIEKIILVKVLGHSKGEIESLFRYLPLIAGSLFVVGCYIIYAGLKSARETPTVSGVVSGSTSITQKNAVIVGLVQAICLPFRGLSRSGSTISAALIQKISRPVAEDFSFALAVVITPPVIFLELHRLLKSSEGTVAMTPHDLVALLQPGLLGMVFSFASGLLALKWLSRWLENGKWAFFGYYCILASLFVLGVQVASGT